MRIATPVDANGQTGSHWGRSHWVAVSEVVDGSIESWDVIEVGWDTSRQSGSHAQHHANVARFLKEHQIEAMVVMMVGGGMRKMMDTMGIRELRASEGDAKASVLAAVAAA